MDALPGADALAIMTPWKEVSGAPPDAIAKAMEGRLVLDPYGGLSPGAFRAAGLRHFQIGRA
jgi:UDPglucose 6-dehydrogenase